jgi:hypothetical protein
LWPRVSNNCPSGFHPEILCHIGHHLYYSEHGKFHRNRFGLGFRCRDRSEQQIKTGNFLVIGYIQYTDQFGLLHHTRLAFNPDGDSVRPWVARRSQSITIIKKPIDPHRDGSGFIQQSCAPCGPAASPDLACRRSRLASSQIRASIVGPPDVATAQQRTGIILRHRFDDRRLRIFP